MQNRLKLLYLLRILQTKTDEEHGMRAEELEEELEKVGIRAERKTIYHDIQALKDMGYDVIASRSKKNYGYFLGSQTFEMAELRILMDAVQSAAFLSQSKTKNLIRKLKSQVSVYQAKELAGQVQMANRQKTANGEVLYNIDAIQRAISLGKKISFTYHRAMVRSNKPYMGRGKTFLLSPYVLLWENDRYYMVGNYEKYDNLSHYRLDRMKSVVVLEEDVRSFEEISAYRGVFNTADYVKRNFNMFGGEEETVHLLCGQRGLEILLDKFGMDMAIMKIGADGPDESYKISVELNRSEGLVEWLVQFGEVIEVIGPPELRQSVEKKLRRIASVYNLEIK